MTHSTTTPAAKELVFDETSAVLADVYIAHSDHHTYHIAAWRNGKGFNTRYIHKISNETEGESFDTMSEALAYCNNHYQELAAKLAAATGEDA